MPKELAAQLQRASMNAVALGTFAGAKRGVQTKE